MTEPTTEPQNQEPHKCRAAQQLGRRNKGVPKNMSAEAFAQRRAAAAASVVERKQRAQQSGNASQNTP